MMSRRDTLLGVGAVAGLLAGVRGMFSIPPAHAARAYEVVHSPAEWQKLLQPAQYNVLRQAGTERPGSSPLNKEKRAGVFSCAGCALPLFSSATKFESGTGWPSFWKPLDKAVVEESDTAPHPSRGAKCRSSCNCDWLLARVLSERRCDLGSVYVSLIEGVTASHPARSTRTASRASSIAPGFTSAAISI